MPRHATFLPSGVIPAALLPFDVDLAIDEAGFREHLRAVGATDGISAITVNAHSTEVASCSFDEQRRVKEALVLLGRLKRAVVRPPLVKLEPAEIAKIRRELIEAGLLGREQEGRDAANGAIAVTDSRRPPD